MLVSDIYKKTKAWMFEKPSSTIYDNSIIDITNKILAETYEDNNMCRMFKGKLPFIDGMAAHQVSSIDDDVDYEDEYLLDVIPKGIDAKFIIDDDLGKYDIYETEYNNAKVTRQCLVPWETVERLTQEAHDAL